MLESFKGKMLVRRSKLANGKDALILVGTFFPSEPIENYSDRDEMWAVELSVINAAKFEGTGSGFPGSPEDFLEGEGQNPNSYWKPKS